MIDPQAITHDIVAETFCDAFRRRVGSGPNKVRLDDLSDFVAIDVRTLKAWRDGQSSPQIHMLLKLAAYFGPAFMSEILCPAGQGGVDVLEPVDLAPQETATDLATTTAELLQRLRDGKFCHIDRAVMGPKLIDLGRELEAQGRAMLIRHESEKAA